jgi:hypothetical protein
MIGRKHLMELNVCFNIYQLIKIISQKIMFEQMKALPNQIFMSGEVINVLKMLVLVGVFLARVGI